MRRKKLKIQRSEDVKARQVKYSKHKTRILKKAKEVSILCDVDVALLFSSPPFCWSKFQNQLAMEQQIREREFVVGFSISKKLFMHFSTISK
ncbi:hypothetical protein Gotur_030097, partial [Gossypium turneri]